VIAASRKDARSKDVIIPISASTPPASKLRFHL
jgi:hypothetical protein